jgi:hypothetical protein
MEAEQKANKEAIISIVPCKSALLTQVDLMANG